MDTATTKRITENAATGDGKSTETITMLENLGMDTETMENGVAIDDSITVAVDDEGKDSGTAVDAADIGTDTHEAIETKSGPALYWERVRLFRPHLNLPSELLIILCARFFYRRPKPLLQCRFLVWSQDTNIEHDDVIPHKCA